MKMKGRPRKCSISRLLLPTPHPQSTPKERTLLAPTLSPFSILRFSSTKQDQEGCACMDQNNRFTCFSSRNLQIESPLPGPAPRGVPLQSHRPCVQKGPVITLTLCCCPLESHHFILHWGPQICSQFCPLTAWWAK